MTESWNKDRYKVQHLQVIPVAGGMLGNAVMREPEEMVSPEQEVLTLELRLMSEQMEVDRLKRELDAVRKRVNNIRSYRTRAAAKKYPRFSFSISDSEAEEISAWMEQCRKMTLKQAPKGVIKFSSILSKRIAERAR
jgi:hypothetical protein